MMKLALFGGAIALALAAPLAAAPAHPSAIVDPPRDTAFPAHNQQLLIPSHGVGMNALLFVAAGKGPHPTVILMHGLPGNERNLDLAQAIRRAGWDVLTFTYRGAWGSPGNFSISNAMEDTQAALDFGRSEAGAKLGIDPRHIVLAGHSMGGATAAATAARNKGIDGLILIDAWDIGADGREYSKAQLLTEFDDFGNSLHGATPESTTDEILSHLSEWDLVQTASHLRLPVLTVTAKFAGAASNRPVTAAIRRSGNSRVTAIEVATDHAFSDHRIALAQTVIGWLNKLRR